VNNQRQGSAKNLIDTAHATVTIEGISTLIVHRRSETPNPECRTPEDEFEASLYVLREGVHGFPSDGVYSSLKTANGGRLPGVTIMGGRLLELAAPAPKMGSAPVNRNGVPTTCYRPEYFPWAINVPVFFDQNQIGFAELVQLFEAAGLNVGIGDWRPEKGGNSGRFRVCRTEFARQGKAVQGELMEKTACQKETAPLRA